MMKKLIVTGTLALGLLLSATALAMEENVPRNLPTSAPMTAQNAAENKDEYSSKALETYVNGMDAARRSCLMPSELERLPRVMERLQKGEKPAKSVLNLTENVRIGVYAVKPEDYEGHSAYALLPDRELTDEELFQLAAAFQELNLELNQDSLSYANCMRGGGFESTRGLSEDERGRMQVLKKLYKRAGEKPKTPYTPLPGDDGVGHIRLREDSFSGLDEFAFRPYRKMTDDELLRIIEQFASEDDGPAVAASEYAKLEKQVRDELTRVLNVPVSMDLTHEEMTTTKNRNVYLKPVDAYGAWFETAGDKKTEYHALMDYRTGKVLWATMLSSDRPLYSDLHLNPFDEKWKQAAEDYVRSIRKDGVRIAKTECLGERSVPFGGFGALLHVKMEDGSEYHLDVLYQTGKVGGGVEYFGQPPLPESPVNR